MAGHGPENFEENVAAARELGIDALLFHDARQARAELQRRGVRLEGDPATCLSAR